MNQVSLQLRKVLLVNVQLLIHSVVQQTTVLIAQLATSGGVRAPLSHIAGQVFTDLAAELENQGLSRKVTADMFGISLRSYQRRVARLRESSTEQGRTLWEAITSELEAQGARTKEELLTRFNRDDEELVRGILNDLVETGIVSVTGAGASAVFRTTEEDDYRKVRSRDTSRGVSEFVWALVFRSGPIGLTRLSELCHVPENELDAILADLVASKRVQTASEEGETLYESAQLVVPRDAKVGWEASVYDHFQAMVSTLSARLHPSEETEPYAKYMGGSTYSFDVGPDHPLREDVLRLLSDFRDKASELRGRVVEYNNKNGVHGMRERVVAYAGQHVVPDEAEEAG